MKNQKNISPKAAVLLIGNEILSGRTQDKNLAYIAKWLNEIGIEVGETRVIRDEEIAIIEAVNGLRSQYEYVFTTGGIGPTHDDITSACIAAAFERKLVENPEALALLQEHYQGDLNIARRRMAMMPEEVSLISNPVSKAPGFQIENVFVLAGIPKVMHAMLENLRSRLRGGDRVKSVSIKGKILESAVAEKLGDIQAQFPEVEIGSYPYFGEGGAGAALVARSRNTALLADVEVALVSLIESFGTVAEKDSGS